MPTLSEGFTRYLAACSPQDWHKAEVWRYRQRLHDVLSSQYRVMAFFQSGSFRHGTAVTPYSDVDYLVRLHFEDKPGSSTTILNGMRKVLADNLWESNSVYVSRPTVTVDFPGVIARYEITPGYWLRGSDDNDRVLHIPAGGGAWREAAPSAHREFIARTDQERGGAVRAVARLLKAWKYEHGVPISSFYLEMRAAEHGTNHESVFALTAVRDVVAKLVREDLPAMNDPTGLVSRIAPCASETARTTTLSALRAAQTHMDGAVRAWLANDRWEMNEALQAMWGTHFPYCDT
jgi:hypothetical protein